MTRVHARHTHAPTCNQSSLVENLHQPQPAEAYIYPFVSLIKMLKALMSIVVYSIGVAFRRESFKSDVMLNMVVISVGIGITTYDEVQFDTHSVVLQFAAIAFEATRLVLIQILLMARGITLSSMTSLYYVAPGLAYGGKGVAVTAAHQHCCRKLLRGEVALGHWAMEGHSGRIVGPSRVLRLVECA